MLRRRTLFLLCSLAAIALRAAAADATNGQATGGDSGKFLRLTRDANGNLVSMDTAIVSYVPVDGRPNGLHVDLIGAVHIGERGYYEQLNRAFEDYDVVLYELVAPKGTRIPKGGARRSAHPVSLLQSGMKDMLGLEAQVERIDYQKQNLMHADMSPDDFSKSMEDRGDNMFAMFFRVLGRSLAQQSKQQALAQSGKRAGRSTSDADLLLALFDPKRSNKLKQLMAEQFEDLEGMMDVLEGPDGSTLISERNKVALKELNRQMESGKRKIGIFYGAGHLPDMEKRLIKDFDLKRDSVRWLPAWHLADDAGKSAAKKPNQDAEKDNQASQN